MRNPIFILTLAFLMLFTISCSDDSPASPQKDIVVEVLLHSVPEGAVVTIDGEMVGVTPFVLKRVNEEVFFTVEVSLYGFQPWKTGLSAQPRLQNGDLNTMVAWLNLRKTPIDP